MIGIGKEFPFELELCKAAAVMVDRAYVSLAQPGPLSDFHWSLTREISDKHGDAVNKIFRPTSECPLAPSPLSLTKALKDGLLNQEVFRLYAEQLDTGVWGSTLFQDKNDPILGDINPMAAIQLMLFTGLPTFEHADRIEKHNALLVENEATIESSFAHILIPNYTEMSWEDIVEFRHHPYWSDYQNLLNKCTDINEMNDRINDGFAKVGVRALSSEQSTWVRLIAQLPIPVVPLPNPLSMFNEWRAWRIQRRNDKEFPWLKVIAHGRRLADNYKYKTS